MTLAAESRPTLSHVDREGSPGRRWTLFAVCGATFMLLVDLMVVQVALPTIQREVGGSFTDLQWVINSYALTLAAFILAFGSAADRFGRKRVFVFGMGVFTGGSLLCGLAGTIEVLIAARALQGVGGAAMFATGLALIGQDFQGAARGRAIAVWGATVGMAVASGPLVGGLLADTLGWRWIFFINVPIGVATVLAASRLSNVGDPGAKRLDWAGLITFSSSLSLLMVGLLRGNAEGWSSAPIVVLLVGAAALLAAFVVVELRQPRPMLDLSLLRRPAFVGVSLATLAIGAGMFAALPFLTLYLQNYLGFSPLVGGLCLLPGTAMCFVVPLATRSYVDKLSPGLVLGGGLATTGLGLVAMHRLTVGGSWIVLIPGLVLAGIGVGIANPSIAKIALSVVPPERTGMASGISNTCRITGVALGIAALGAFFERQLTTSLQAELGHPSTQLAAALASSGTTAAEKLEPTHPGLLAASQEAFVSSINGVLAIGAALVLLGAVAALTLVRSRHFANAGASAPPQPADAIPEPTLP
jgi:EmrB/QacA subfamily drug resistance transporter